MNALLAINLRRPFAAELEWFSRERFIAGYAADDDQVVLNPYSSLSEHERACVVRNEAMRIFMRKLGICPSVDLTVEQIESFRGTAYETDHASLRQTIIARIASGDPSAGHPTERQLGFAHAISAIFDRLVTLSCDEDSSRPLLRIAARSWPSTGAEAAE